MCSSDLGAIGAPQSGRQADDQKLGRIRAKGRHRRVEPVGMRPALGSAERGESRAQRAFPSGQVFRRIGVLRRLAHAGSTGSSRLR